MAFTLNQFQSALNQKAGVVTDAIPAGAEKVSKAIDKSVVAAGKTVGAVKGALPASNKKVDGIAAKFNTRLNNVEMEQRVQDVYVNMIAQATGVALPSKEEVIEELIAHDEAEKASQATQAIMDAVNNPEMVNMFGMIAQKLFGFNPFAPIEEDDEEIEVEEEVEVVEETKVTEPVKLKVVEKPVEQETIANAQGLTGPRRKLGRHAPLAD